MSNFKWQLGKVFLHLPFCHFKFWLNQKIWLDHFKERYIAAFDSWVCVFKLNENYFCVPRRLTISICQAHLSNDCDFQRDRTRRAILQYHNFDFLFCLLGLVWQVYTNQVQYNKGCSKLKYLLAKV